MKLLKSFLCVNIIFFCGFAMAQTDPADFSCNGELHGRVKTQWKNTVKKEIGTNQINRLMLGEGDVYPLYDIEVYLYNFVAMSQRCKDQETLTDIAQTLLPVFDALSSSPGKRGQRWICKGGTRCNAKNGLRGKEVELTSLQFLGLSTTVAAALSSGEAKPSSGPVQAFIDKSTQTAFDKLGDYSKDKSYTNNLQKITKISSSDVKGSPNKSILRDHEVWMLVMLANLAGTKESGTASSVDADMRQLARQLTALFKSRTYIGEDAKTHRKVAEIDRGFWRARSDTRYAGYEGRTPPSGQCTGADMPSISSQSKLARADAGEDREAPPVKPSPVDSVGWDISHARRLVPLFDAMRNYGSRFAAVYGVPAQEAIGNEVATAYAHQLTAKLWNQDQQRPLFKNFWSGANGWYRVGYQDGAKCNTGYPPFGLSSAIPVGGYLAWSGMSGELAGIGKALFTLVNSQDAESKAFVERYYEELSSAVPQRTRDLNRFMFHASLVK
ncbi:MAG: hypothetical protein ACN6O3_14530 [Comamonas sp.]